MAQIIVTTTGCKDIVRGEHMEQLPEDAIVCNVRKTGRDQTPILTKHEGDPFAICGEVEGRRGPRHFFDYIFDDSTGPPIFVFSETTHKFSPTHQKILALALTYFPFFF